MRTISVNMKCMTTEGKGFKIEHEQDQGNGGDRDEVAQTPIPIGKRGAE